MTGNIVVAVLAAFVLLMIYIGMEKGILKLIYSLIAMILSLVISQCISLPLSNILINDTPIYSTIKENTDKYVDENVKNQLVDITNENIDEVINELEIPSVIKNTVIKKGIESNTGVLADAICEEISKAFASLCIKVMVSVIIFIVFVISMRMLAVTFGLMSKLPVINVINKGVGGAVGFAEAVVIIWLIGLVITAMAGTEFGSNAMKLIMNNDILRFIYNSDIFIRISGLG